MQFILLQFNLLYIFLKINYFYGYQIKQQNKENYKF